MQTAVVSCKVVIPDLVIGCNGYFMAQTSLLTYTTDWTDLD